MLDVDLQTMWIHLLNSTRKRSPIRTSWTATSQAAYDHAKKEYAKLQ